MTTESVAEQSERSADNGNLLTREERIECQGLAAAEDPDGRHAKALLILDEGLTQEAAGQRSGLTKGQVRYWLGKFRKSRMAIFSDAPPAPDEPQPEPEEPTSEPTATAGEAIIDPAMAIEETQPEDVPSAATIGAVKMASTKKKASKKKSKKGKKTRKGTKGKNKKKKEPQNVKGKKKKKAKKAPRVKKGKKKKGKKKQSGKKNKKTKK